MSNFFTHEGKKIGETRDEKTPDKRHYQGKEDTGETRTLGKEDTRENRIPGKRSQGKEDTRKKRTSGKIGYHEKDTRIGGC